MSYERYKAWTNISCIITILSGSISLINKRVTTLIPSWFPVSHATSAFPHLKGYWKWWFENTTSSIDSTPVLILWALHFVFEMVFKCFEAESRPALPNRNTRHATNVIFNFLVATLKMLKETGEINVNNIFCLFQLIQNNYDEIFYILLSYCLWNPCMLYTHGTSQFRPATLQMLHEASDYHTGRCTSSFFCLRSWMVKSKEKQGHVLKGAGSSEGFIWYGMHTCRLQGI